MRNHLAKRAGVSSPDQGPWSGCGFYYPNSSSVSRMDRVGLLPSRVQIPDLRSARAGADLFFRSAAFGLGRPSWLMGAGPLKLPMGRGCGDRVHTTRKAADLRSRSALVSSITGWEGPQVQRAGPALPLPALVYCRGGLILGRSGAASGISAAAPAASKGVLLVPPVRLTTMVKAAG
jgi:hypothetical protein